MKKFDLKIFELAIENVFDHIIITDPDGKILYANQAACKLTGFSQAEMLGNKPSLWGRQMPFSYYKKLWRSIKKNKKTFVGEIINKRKNGQLYNAEVRISPILNRSGKVLYFVGIERDITKAKEMDREKNEFISIASHQLKNPLTIVNGYLQILMKKGTALSQQKERGYLKEIYLTNRKVLDLIDLLLNISKIELGIFTSGSKRVNLAKILQGVMREIRLPIREKRIILRQNYPRGGLFTKTDIKLTNIIFYNLLSNAVKYTPESGEVKIEAWAERNSALVKISDSGCGIPPKEEPKIFTRLFRASNVKNKEGIGLGLYIVKMIVEKMKGKIWFESQLGVGTTFYVRLPLIQRR